MEINDLNNKIEEYKATQESIKKNRLAWQENTKALLFKTLNEIKDQFPIGLKVQDLNMTKNLEGVKLTFGKTISGITDTDIDTNMKKTTRQIFKEGGSICFGQNYIGEVIVFIQFPSIEKFVSQRKLKILKKYVPELLTKELIVKNVSKFLDEIIKWEKSYNKNSLGYLKE